MQRMKGRIPGPVLNGILDALIESAEVHWTLGLKPAQGGLAPEVYWPGPNPSGDNPPRPRRSAS
jgi:hypothetical protein